MWPPLSLSSISLLTIRAELGDGSCETASGAGPGPGAASGPGHGAASGTASGGSSGAGEPDEDFSVELSDSEVSLEGYRIGEHIAVGGFGNVWRAEHIRSGRMVAIKVLHPHLISSEELVLRFGREALAIARMRHPNIVELCDHGRLGDGRPYLVTEYLSGADLSTHIALRGALAPDEVLRILEQLGRALAAAHTQGIVHRDVKASNVLLSNRDGGLRVVLLDFGVAKLLDDAGPRLTMSHVLVGSPSCMSPEQIQNHPVDARTDVYALGALTYHMLTGARLFASASPAEVVNMHLYVYPPLPSTQGDVPAAFDQVIMKALSKNAEDRHASAAAFVDAFRAALRESRAGVEQGRTRPRTMPAVGIYVDVGAPPDLLDEPDDELLDDMEAIPLHAARYLESCGYWQAWERGNSSLFVQPLPVAAQFERPFRYRAVDAALALFEALLRRPSLDPRVEVTLHVHVSEMRVQGDLTGAWAGALADIQIEGGPLLDVGAWAPRGCGSGVLASTTVLQELSWASEEVPCSPAVRRILREEEP